MILQIALTFVIRCVDNLTLNLRLHIISCVSDKVLFANTGQVNRYNMHYWSDINPYWMRIVSHQHP